MWLSKRKTHAGVVFALTINVRHVGFEIHLRTPACRHLRLIFLSGCQKEMQSRPALIFIENHFETVKKGKWSGLSLVVHQGSSVSSHWTLKPLDWGSNHIDLQRYTVFLILDQPEKTLGSVRLKCHRLNQSEISFKIKQYKIICFLWIHSWFLSQHLRLVSNKI